MKTDKPHKRKKLLVVVLIAVVMVIGVGAGGFFWYKMKAKQEAIPSKADIPLATMDDKLIGFTFTVIPELYDKLIQINKEISLIDTELSRLKNLETEYPQQKNIVAKEKVIWERIKKSLLTVMQSFEKNIETFYVAHSINPEKGKELIETKKTELEAAATEILQASRTETARIHVDPPLTFTQQLKAKFFK